MANILKHLQKSISTFIINSFRPEEVEVTVTKVGNRVVYRYSKIKH